MRILRMANAPNACPGETPRAVTFPRHPQLRLVKGLRRYAPSTERRRPAQTDRCGQFVSAWLEPSEGKADIDREVRRVEKEIDRIQDELDRFNYNNTLPIDRRLLEAFGAEPAPDGARCVSHRARRSSAGRTTGREVARSSRDRRRRAEPTRTMLSEHWHGLTTLGRTDQDREHDLKTQHARSG